MRLVKIAALCSLYESRSTIHKEADLKEDMVKRIFLSILPAVSSKTELYHTQGFPDYNLLKSAAAGAFDIVRYGAAACIGELEHYGARSGGGGYDLPTLLNSDYMNLFGKMPSNVMYPVNGKPIMSLAGYLLRQGNEKQKGSSESVEYHKVKQLFQKITGDIESLI